MGGLELSVNDLLQMEYRYRVWFSEINRAWDWEVERRDVTRSQEWEQFSRGGHKSSEASALDAARTSIRRERAIDVALSNTLARRRVAEWRSAQ
jgi:hypothetical protein